MWPLPAVVMIALVVAATSSADFSLNPKNLHTGAMRRRDFDQLEKFESVRAAAAAAAAAGPFPQDPSDFGSAVKYEGPFNGLSVVEELDGGTDEIIPLIEGSEEDTDNEQLSAFLAQLLQEPGVWEPPLVLVEEPMTWQASLDDNSFDKSEALAAPWKRSRYYRRYPWKRQNSRSRYDDGSRYLCTPTRDDVFQLLRALHDARQGDKTKTVNFCNRRRPAGSVFTNIRFLGRRK